MNSTKYCSFEAREREVQFIDFWVREFVFITIAIFGSVRNGWATRVGKTKDFGDLVEAFADGIVVGGADNFEIVVGGHVKNLGMAAGNDEREQRKLWVLLLFVLVLFVPTLFGQII